MMSPIVILTMSCIIAEYTEFNYMDIYTGAKTHTHYYEQVCSWYQPYLSALEQTMHSVGFWSNPYELSDLMPPAIPLSTAGHAWAHNRTRAGGQTIHVLD